MKSAILLIAASLLVAGNAIAGSIEGTYSGWVERRDYMPFKATFTISDVTGRTAKVTNEKGNSAIARFDGNVLTFSSNPKSSQKLVNTLTIKGNVAEYFVKNVDSGLEGHGMLTKH